MGRSSKKKKNGMGLIIVGQNRGRWPFFVSTFINLHFPYFSDNLLAYLKKYSFLKKDCVPQNKFVD